MTHKSTYLEGATAIAVETELIGSTLNIRVRFTRDLRWFFKDNAFYLRYEDEITAGEGLLAVAAVGLLLPLAWMTGASIRVAKLDRTFGQAAEALQNEFAAMYPKMPFGTQLIVDEWIDNPPNPEGSGLLYSGGLDANYSFFANRDKRPRLIQVLGTEFPLAETGFVDLVKTESSGFAKKHDVPISYINTNYFELFDPVCLMHRFVPVRERVGGDLWKGLGYALGFLAMAAPLSAGRFNHLIIAAWANEEHADRMRENPDASSPRADEKIRWSNLRVEHHGCLHRYQKVRKMKDWLPGNILRVCWRFRLALDQPGQVNCSRCEKCARTITALAIGGVDPVRCGFEITPDTLTFMKELLASRKVPKNHLALWWGAMQREIPEKLEDERFGLADFLRWLRTFDLGDGLDNPKPMSVTTYFYHRFPYAFSRVVRSLIFSIIRKKNPHIWITGGKNAKKK